MKLSFSARQINLRDSLKELATEKMARYDRFFADDALCHVTFSCPHNKEKVEITIDSDNTVFRAEEEADTFRTAFDGAMDSLDRQIRKNKTRLEKRMRTDAFANMGWQDDNEADTAPEIIKTKNFVFKPMSPEEAVLQMELLGHTFYVFINQDDEKTCVVYKRKDGNYGLICPQ